jgi:hypothetical protein
MTKSVQYNQLHHLLLPLRSRGKREKQLQQQTTPIIMPIIEAVAAAREKIILPTTNKIFRGKHSAWYNRYSTLITSSSVVVFDR